MAKLTITGSTQPVVGNTEAYSLSVFDNLVSSNSFSFPPPKVEWSIHVKDRKGWRITHGNAKVGENITYKFTHKSLKYKALRIEVTRGKDKGELYIKPQPAVEAKILRVDLLDINSQRLQKGKQLHYKDTLIAKAHCVGMFGHKVSFTLWEDDAIGEGHDPVINMMNRINPVPLIGEVDHEGIAKVVFRLPSYTMAVQIANAQVARGDKSEGKTHEYYVTAEMVSKHILKASPNVNVANPSHIPEPPKKPKPEETDPAYKKSSGASQNKVAKPDKPKPKTETPKFPQTPAAKKQADPEGKILNAEFTDGTGKPLRSAKTGDIVSIKISSQNMKGKNVKVRIWEEDFSRYSNDLIYEVSVRLNYNTTNFINGVVLTKDMYTKSNDWGEGNEREYFIEVERLNTSVTSQVIPVNPDAEPVKVDANDSPAVIKEKKEEKKTCICEESKLYWGKHFTCLECKKIIEISKRLLCDPNHLTSAMALETGGKFDPSLVNDLGYTGLVQIGSDAAHDINRRKGTNIEAGKKGNLKNMNKFEQLTYVEYYLEPFRAKLNTLVDFYLAILMPIDCGKGTQDNHVVFDKNLILDYNSKGDVIKNTKWIRKKGYAKNPVFHKEGSEEDGKTYVWEIAKEIEGWYRKGALNKAIDFQCQKDHEHKIENTKDSKWHDPIDNPEIALFNFSGIEKPKGSSFGLVRTRPNGTLKNHQGLDIFAPKGTPVKACLKGTVVLVSENAGAFGKLVVIEVDKGDLDKARMDYKLQYQGEKEKGPSFGDSDKRFLRYGHLSEISVENKQEVTAGMEIGKSGNTGNASKQNIKARHLHFEITDEKTAGEGLNNRENPAFYVRLKAPNKNRQENNKR
ncbi:M23 family metallopeptidase [Chryseobacterium bernardetii]|uniref:M23 family metallopeptidase n=1 Tax=Chryseobacterium bernardetii TaxID=1241978 RepID=UPI0016263286|nr:M23 family metallopeptidase [Chryseobacterium bernardetii]